MTNAIAAYNLPRKRSNWKEGWKQSQDVIRQIEDIKKEAETGYLYNKYK